MYFSRFNGLELPVYGPDTEVLSGESALRHRGLNPGGDHFVRLARLDAPGYYSLRGCLRVAEEEFERVGELTDTRPLEPQWGLFRIPYLDALQRTEAEHSLLPFGTVLVAKVANLRLQHDLQPDQRPYNQRNIVTGISQYQSSQKGRLSDVAIMQFAYGVEPGYSEPEYRFVDIEPRLRRRWPSLRIKNILRTLGTSKA